MAQSKLLSGVLCSITATPPNNSASTQKAQNEAQEEAPIHRSVSEYFPMIRRGFTGEEQDEGAPEVAAVGWKHDVASRKEREEGLR